VSSWKDPVEVTPRWRPEPSAGGIGRPKRRRALNVSSQRKQEMGEDWLDRRYPVIWERS
jgi:hypothetical protein